MNNETSGPAVASMVPCVNYRVIKQIRCFSNCCPLAVEMRTNCKYQNPGKTKGSSKIWYVIIELLNNKFLKLFNTF
jgi:hypothetical protein